MKEANLPEPEFHTDGIFTVVFRRKYSVINDTVNKIEQKVFDLIREKQGLKAIDISKTVSKSLRTTMRYLKSLSEKHLIEFQGAPKTGGYYIKKK